MFVRAATDYRHAVKHRPTARLHVFSSSRLAHAHRCGTGPRQRRTLTSLHSDDAETPTGGRLAHRAPLHAAQSTSALCVDATLAHDVAASEESHPHPAHPQIPRRRRLPSRARGGAAAGVRRATCGTLEKRAAGNVAGAVARPGAVGPARHDGSRRGGIRAWSGPPTAAMARKNKSGALNPTDAARKADRKKVRARRRVRVRV